MDEKLKKLTFEVTQAHIDQGAGYRALYCPVARCLKSMGFSSVIVGKQVASLDSRSLVLDQTTIDFIKAHDADETKVTPFIGSGVWSDS